MKRQNIEWTHTGVILTGTKKTYKNPEIRINNKEFGNIQTL